MTDLLSKKWLTTEEAAEILTTNSGHPISKDYVRRLGNIGRLRTTQLDQRTKLFWRGDVERYTVKARGTGEVRRAVRAKKQTSAA